MTQPTPPDPNQPTPLPPQAPENHRPPDDPLKVKTTGDTEDRADATFRRRMGYWVGGLGLALAVVVGYLSLQRLAGETVPPNATSATIAMFGIKLVAEAAVSVALIFLGYQLIRMAERMMMPRWFTTRDNIDVMRALLGIDTPADGAAKVLDSVTKLADKIKPGGS